MANLSPQKPVKQPADGQAEVNWGLEVMQVFGTIGKVLLRIFSYVLNILLTVLLIGLITGIIVGTVFAIYINNYMDLTIDPSLLRTSASGTTTTRFYVMEFDSEEDRINRNGTPVEWEDERISGASGSIWVTYDQFPKYLIDAFVAMEDHRFMEHSGVDWITTGKAVFNYFTGNSVAGGSTITQQLIKNLTGEDEVTIQRKVQEIFRALNLEKELSKEEILEMYLNIVNLGNGAEGVQAAANLYFGKDVSELNLVQCACLASIVKSPTAYEPLYHEEDRVRENGTVQHGNRHRRNDVIFRMNELGWISDAEAEAAYEADLEITYFDTTDEFTQSEGYHVYNWYIEAVIDQLTEHFMEKYGWSQSFAGKHVLSSGYKVYLPIDMDVQNTLEEVYIHNDAQYFPTAGNAVLQPQSAMVIMDPYTGDVLGLVGGRGEKTGSRVQSLATDAKRPPGSSIKPITVYAPALEEGIITYGSVYDDTPLYFDEESRSGDSVVYDPYPHNLPDTYQGLCTINRAIEVSKNTVAMKVLEDLTVEKAFDFGKNKLHINSLVESYTRQNGTVITDKGLAALGLGQLSFGLTVLEITAAYCIFQNDGVYNEPNLYLYVTDNSDNVILENDDDPEIVISPETASIMTKMMNNVVNNGTGTSITLRHSVDVAGKTGTTTADFDRYFVGYTPYYVAGVWTGYEMNQTLSAFKANPSVTIWDTVMTMLHKEYIDAANAGGEALKTFEMAPGVIQATYCLDSGLLCSEACSLDPRGSRAATGYFTRESAPSEYCDTHVIVMRDATTGLIASDECNPGDLVKTALIRVEDRDFPTEIYVADAQYVYRDLPANVMPCEWGGLPFFYNSLGEGHYCGTSYATTANNGYCYLHCDYSRWKGGPSKYETETETAAPPEVDPGDVLDGTEDSGMGVDETTYYEDETLPETTNGNIWTEDQSPPSENEPDDDSHIIFGW